MWRRVNEAVIPHRRNSSSRSSKGNFRQGSVMAAVSVHMCLCVGVDAAQMHTSGGTLRAQECSPELSFRPDRQIQSTARGRRHESYRDGQLAQGVLAVDIAAIVQC